MTSVHNNPVVLLTGRKVLAEEGSRLGPAGARALIVTGRSSAVRSGLLADLTAVLDRNGVRWYVFDGVTENPDSAVVLEGALYAREVRADRIIGAGGGSPMDAAKAIAVLAANRGCRRRISGCRKDAPTFRWCAFPPQQEAAVRSPLTRS